MTSFLKFISIGIAATMIHVAIAIIFISSETFKSPTANAISFLLATSFSYYFNAAWSFQSEPSFLTLKRYLLTCFIGFWMSFGIAQLYENNNLPYHFAIITIILALPPMMFLIHKFWTFK